MLPSSRTTVWANLRSLTPVGPRIQNLEAELLELRKHQATSGEVSSTEHRIRTPSESHAASEISASGDAGGAAGLNRSSSGTNNPYALNPDDLDAPVTVIHAMTPRTPRLHARHRGWDGDQMNLLPSITPPQDFISEGLLDEAVARELFNRLVIVSRGSGGRGREWNHHFANRLQFNPPVS
jgi:hypothetical protein